MYRNRWRISSTFFASLALIQSWFKNNLSSYLHSEVINLVASNIQTGGDFKTAFPRKSKDAIYAYSLRSSTKIHRDTNKLSSYEINWAT